jgi:hypothetical protein
MADGHLGAVGVIVPGRALEDTEKGHEIVQIQYQITSVRMRSVETAEIMRKRDATHNTVLVSLCRARHYGQKTFECSFRTHTPKKGCRDRDHMVVGFTTTYAISFYHL